MTQPGRVHHCVTYWFLDWPVRELLCVTEMSQIEDVTEEFILQLRILDHWHSTVLHGEQVKK